MATTKRLLMTGVLSAGAALLLVLLTSSTVQAQSPFYPEVQKPVPRTMPMMLINPKNIKTGLWGPVFNGPVMYGPPISPPRILASMKSLQLKRPHVQPRFGPNLP